MRLILCLSLFLAACGDDSSSSRILFTSNKKPIPHTVYQTLAIGKPQNHTMFRVGKFSVKNNAASKLKVLNFFGEIRSSNFFLDRVGIRILRDGKVTGKKPWFLQYHQTFTKIQIDCDETIEPNQTAFFNVLARPWDRDWETKAFCP